MLEFYQYVWLFVAITCGSLADTLMWGPQEKDWKPLRDGFGHIPWLIVFWGICIPSLPLMAILLDWTMVDFWRFLTIAVGFSAWWDLLYTKLTYDMWAKGIKRWLVIPIPDGIIRQWFDSKGWIDREQGVLEIGPRTTNQMWIFNGIRLSFLIWALFI